MQHDEPLPGHPLLHRTSARQRVMIAAAFGLVVGGVAGALTSWQFALLSAWDTTGAIVVAGSWLGVRNLDPEQTRRLATREDDSRVSTHLLLVSASVASLGGTAFDVVKAGQTAGAAKFVLSALAVVTVTVSWLVVHTLFMLRYAHEFYTPPIGGIDFKAEHEKPDYRDFAYVAFTVGMTFQVSDTDIQSRVIRRTVLRQALLAYLFGAVILGVTVNVLANLF